MKPCQRMAQCDEKNHTMLEAHTGSIRCIASICLPEIVSGLQDFLCYDHLHNVWIGDYGEL